MHTVLPPSRRALLVAVSALLLGICPRPADAVPGNPGIVTVAPAQLHGFDRLVALSDVHGMYAHTRALLQAAGLIDKQTHWAGGHTLLVVVGDSIDKGPQSLEILALWIRLEHEAPKQGGQVMVLLGNHEAALLADPEHDTKLKTLEAELEPLDLRAADLVGGDSENSIAGLPLARYRSFLRHLPVAARIGDWLFCHAGWVPEPPQSGTTASRWQALVRHDRRYKTLADGDGADFLERKEYPDGVRWTTNPDAVRELERRLDCYGLRGAVFGHVPEAFGIEDNIGYSQASDHRLIKLDSGMAPEAGGNPGHLLVFPHPDELASATPSAVHAQVGHTVQGILKLEAPVDGPTTPSEPARHRPPSHRH